jgi:hypothetical protein
MVLNLSGLDLAIGVYYIEVKTEDYSKTYKVIKAQ